MIVVHVDATTESKPRLQIACELAERHRASVRALFGATPASDQGSFTYSASAALDRAAEHRELRHEQAKAHLQHSLEGNGPEVTWYDVVGDTFAHGFVQETAFADLAVVGQQPFGTSRNGGAPSGFVEAVVMEGGRPTLVIPHLWDRQRVGERVLIAWNGSPQAARAVSGALPLLRLANEVHAVTWAHGPSTSPFSRLDIKEYLGKHEIPLTLHRRDPSGHVGEELIAMAEALRADLIVMGCYGHRRTTERLLGGATRSILALSTVPILMMH